MGNNSKTIVIIIFHIFKGREKVEHVKRHRWNEENPNQTSREGKTMSGTKSTLDGINNRLDIATK